MKKTKLLIPALSIASVGAVVAPMVTSCTKAVDPILTVSDFNFTPEKKHAATTINSQELCDNITKEFFEEKLGFAEDYANIMVNQDTSAISGITSHKTEEDYLKTQKSAGVISAYTYEFKFTVEDFNAEAKEVKLGGSSEVKGYAISGTIKDTTTKTITRTETQAESYQNIVKETETTVTTMTLQNVFVRIGWEQESYPALQFYGHNRLNWAVSETYENTVTSEFKNGSKQTQYDHDNGGYKREAEGDDFYTGFINAIPVQNISTSEADLPYLQYFANITWTKW